MNSLRQHRRVLAPRDPADRLFPAGPGRPGHAGAQAGPSGRHRLARRFMTPLVPAPSSISMSWDNLLVCAAARICFRSRPRPRHPPGLVRRAGRRLADGQRSRPFRRAAVEPDGGNFRWRHGPRSSCSIGLAFFWVSDYLSALLVGIRAIVPRPAARHRRRHASLARLDDPPRRRTLRRRPHHRRAHRHSLLHRHDGARLSFPLGPATQRLQRKLHPARRRGRRRRRTLSSAACWNSRALDWNACCPPQPTTLGPCHECGIRRRQKIRSFRQAAEQAPRRKGTCPAAIDVSTTTILAVGLGMLVRGGGC